MQIHVILDPYLSGRDKSQNSHRTTVLALSKVESL